MDIGWDMNVQRMIDYVERNLERELSLEAIARRLGYSSSWCTRQFKRATGQTLRGYIRERRLSEAAVRLRDSERGILDIAMEAGFSSQEAFTRAFAELWGMSPGAWRRSRSPIVLRLPRRIASLPLRKGDDGMGIAKKIEISIQAAPELLFVGIWAEGAQDYFGFWKALAERGLDCRHVEGSLASLTANAQIGGWLERGGRRGYLYGVELGAGYAGPVPAGMESMRIPAGSYAVFHHPPYDYERDDEAVYKALGAAMASWDPGAAGFRWNDELPLWQRHDPAAMGQSWCRALAKRRS